MPSVQANGVSLYYDLTGPEDAPVIAFSNSLGSTLEMWDPQVRVLASRFRCLRYDTRGHGRSQAASQPIAIADLAADLVALMTALNIGQADVVGLSMGGMTAQMLAVQRPDLVRRLVLMATSANMTGLPIWGERAKLVREKGMGAVVETVLGRMFTAGFRTAQPAVAAQTAAQINRADPASYAACCEAIGAMDIRDAIRGIAAPTLVIAGALDPATPVAMHSEIQAQIPGADLVVIGGAAHLLNIEKAEAVNRELAAFLDAPVRPGKAAEFAAGLANRKGVLGVEHVERTLARATRFDQPWQDFITRVAWGEIWGDETLPRKTRSMLTLTMMIALHREEEFKLHLRPALRNGVTLDELRALMLQAAIYAGVPATNAAFRWARDVLGDDAA